MIAHKLGNGSSAMRTQGLGWKLAATLASGLALALAAVTMPSFAAMEPAKETAAKDAAPKAETDDVLIFRNGTTLKGKIISETPTTLKFKGMVSGISLETEYNKNELLEIKRGVAKAAGTPGDVKADAKASDTPGTVLPTPGNKVPEVQAGQQRFFYLELTGEFGEEITETPFREAMKEAQKNAAEIIVLTIDANWNRDSDSKKLDIETDDLSFVGIFRALPMLEIMGNEMPAKWTKMPRFVFWVKQAMGPSAFVPLISKEIYFHPEGRMGGVGTLGDLFGGRGNERVVEKQKSLRLQAVVGWALKGGYPEELIRAMTMREYVLSVRFDGGRPVYFERLPESPEEILLTDDGREGNADTLRQIADGSGNDVLTLHAEIAQKLGVSKGTIDNKEQLLTALGLNRVGVDVTGRGEKIMKDWREGLVTTKRQIRRLLEEYGDLQLQPPGGYNERTALRGAQKSKLENVKRLLQRWGEGISQDWMQENRVPDILTIDNQLEQIRIDQLKDKK